MSLKDKKIVTEPETVAEQFVGPYDDCYEIIDPIGRGRNSIVYLARPRANAQLSENYPHLAQRLVALKVIIGSVKHPELNIRRMKREALAMLSCIHPNVIKLSDYRAHGEVCYLAMEYADCGDLRALLDTTSSGLPVGRVFDFALQILAGLEAIHRVGIIHRDVKPENLLLVNQSEIKIADFGISFLPNEKVQLEEANRGIGTFDYLAPECLEEGISNEAADVYSVAVTLFQLITKEMPFAGESFSEQIDSKMRGEVASIARFVDDSPPLLQEFFFQILSADSANRPATAAELRSEIEAYQLGDWTPAPLPLATKARTFSLMSARVKNLAEEESDTLGSSPTGTTNLLAEFASARGNNPGRVGRDFGKLIEFGRLAYPVRLLILLVPLILVALFAKERIFRSEVNIFSSSTTPPGSEQTNKTDLYEQQLFPVTENQDITDFSVLDEQTRHGTIYGLLSDREPTPFYAMPSEDRRTVIVGLAVDGWKPQVVEVAKLKGRRDFTISGSGLVVSLVASGQQSDTANEERLFRGTYKEQVSGRQGTWVLWQ